MRHPIFSALSLATLLLACAHDHNKQHANNEATAAERAENRAERAEDRAENRAERAEHRAERGDERVDVPRRRTDRDRLASANGTVPARRAENNKVGDERADKDNLTALDQGNGEVDLDLTQRIRKAVMADDSLSFSAKNAKIITRDGRVTLRGSVKTSAEKEAIYKCAVGAAGVGHVSNELEIDDD